MNDDDRLGVGILIAAIILVLMVMTVRMARGADLHTKVLYTQVRVRVGTGGGSGTVIYSRPSAKGATDYSTFVLTCHHVVDSAISVRPFFDPTLGKERKRLLMQEVTVEFFDYGASGRVDRTYGTRATIEAYDKLHDMALLKLASTRKADYVATLYPRGESAKVSIGRGVYAVGAALLHDPILTQGVVTHKGDIIDHREYWMSSACIIYGNCLRGDSMVSMANGDAKPIAKIRAGDRVWAFGERGGGLAQTTVKRLIEGRPRELLAVRTRNRLLRASKDHPVVTLESVRDYAGRWRHVPVWRPLNALMTGDKIAVLRKLPNRTRCQGFRIHDVISQRCDPHEFLRFLGFYLGDGWRRIRPSVSYSVELACYSENAWDRYAEIGQNLFRLEPRGNRPKVLAFYGERLARGLGDWGFGGGAKTKTVPAWVMTAPWTQQEAFLEGYTDADGYRNATGAYAFEAASESLIRRMRMLCMHMGYGVSNVTQRERNIQWRGRSVASRCWGFQCYPRPEPHSAALPGDTGLLPNDLCFQSIVSMHDAGTHPTYDLELASHHAFFADGVLVHNSGGAVFTADTHQFIGIPSRVAVIGWGSPITHMGYFSPVERCYEFLREQGFEFIYDHTKTEIGCAEARRVRKAKAQEKGD